VKLSINESAVKLLKERIKCNVPASGLVSMITVTEKQFQNMDFLQGEFVTDIIQSEDKVIEL
jgi:CRISPR-associated protein Cas2